jgi:hypothetical protein
MPESVKIPIGIFKDLLIICEADEPDIAYPGLRKYLLEYLREKDSKILERVIYGKVREQGKTSGEAMRYVNKLREMQENE